MKILLVSSSFYPKIDGSTRCVYDHARKLAQNNIVHLATRGIPGTPQYQVFEDIHVTRSSVSFRSGSLLSKAFLVLDQMLQVLRLERKKRFQVIHVHGYISGVAALLAKYLYRVPLLITTHGTELLWPKELWWKGQTEVKLGLMFERFVLGRCDVIIAQSIGVKNYMIQIYGRSIEKKIAIVHTGVDHRKFNAPPLERPSGKVLFVGALSEVKGVTCLLEAFQKVHRDVPESRLALVGSGPNMKHYKDLVSRMNLDSSVEFHGPVRDDFKLVNLYRTNDIVVLPSNVGGPISCTLMEGLSCGRAVISTDVPGGIPDVLGGGVGLLMKREDREQLASFFLKLMTDQSFLDGMSHRARTAVEDQYTLDSMIDKLNVIYEGLAS